MLLLIVPVVTSTIFVVDIYGNTTIIDVYEYQVVSIDLEALYYEMLLVELVEALQDISGDCQDIDDWSFGFGRDNVVPFGDYRNSRYPW